MSPTFLLAALPGARSLCFRRYFAKCIWMGLLLSIKGFRLKQLFRASLTRIPAADRTSLYSCLADKIAIRAEICTIFTKFLGRSVSFVQGETGQKILTIFKMLALNFNVSSLSWLTVHYCWDTLSPSHHAWSASTGWVCGDCELPCMPLPSQNTSNGPLSLILTSEERMQMPGRKFLESVKKYSIKDLPEGILQQDTVKKNRRRIWGGEAHTINEKYFWE